MASELIVCYFAFRQLSARHQDASWLNEIQVTVPYGTFRWVSDARLRHPARVVPILDRTGNRGVSVVLATAWFGPRCPRTLRALRGQAVLVNGNRLDAQFDEQRSREFPRDRPLAPFPSTDDSSGLWLGPPN